VRLAINTTKLTTANPTKRALDAVHLAEPRFLRFILATAALKYVNRFQQIPAQDAAAGMP
jgi:hypothetical protein